MADVAAGIATTVSVDRIQRKRIRSDRTQPLPLDQPAPIDRTDLSRQ